MVQDLTDLFEFFNVATNHDLGELFTDIPFSYPSWRSPGTCPLPCSQGPCPL